jgi:hypothetical protein
METTEGVRADAMGYKEHYYLVGPTIDSVEIGVDARSRAPQCMLPFDLDTVYLRSIDLLLKGIHSMLLLLLSPL